MANVIFDFDGTIADSFALAVHIYEQLLRGGELVPEAELERLRSMSMLHVALELKIAPWRVPFLLARGRTMMRRKIDTVQAFDGMPELIRQLNQDGHKLFITSSNSVQNIKPLLKRYNLRKEFIKLYGSAGLFGKANLLKRLMRRQKLDPHETFYIGDEVRDIEASRRAGIRVISVTWGYNSESILREHHPDFVAKKPADIRKLLQLKPNAE
ncbi:MAG: HAD-IA family hydrolase [Candidatus Saccharimonadales bacterium]